jgi:hypothetical protein
MGCNLLSNDLEIMQSREAQSNENELTMPSTRNF